MIAVATNQAESLDKPWGSPSAGSTHHVDWRDIATPFDLTGAGIVNVAHFCALEALASETWRVDRTSVAAAIVRVLVKEGKVVQRIRAGR